MSERQVQGLHRTRVPVRDIDFARVDDRGRPDPASALLLTDRSLLPASLDTFEARLSEHD